MCLRYFFPLYLNLVFLGDDRTIFGIMSLQLLIKCVNILTDRHCVIKVSVFGVDISCSYIQPLAELLPSFSGGYGGLTLAKF